MGRLCAISATSCDFLIISKSLDLPTASQPAAHAQQAQDSCFGGTSPSLPRPPQDHLPWTDEHPNMTAPREPLPPDSMARSPPLAPGGSLQHPCPPPALPHFLPSSYPAGLGQYQARTGSVMPSPTRKPGGWGSILRGPSAPRPSTSVPGPTPRQPVPSAIPELQPGPTFSMERADGFLGLSSDFWLARVWPSSG